MIHLYVGTTYKCIMSPRLSAAESRVNEARADTCGTKARASWVAPLVAHSPSTAHFTAMDLRKLIS